MVPIRVPALRERPQDIKLLAEYFLDDFCARNNFKQKKLDDSVYPLLESYPWPGNARELRNAIERMAILTTGERLTREAIPVEIRVQRDPSPRSSVQEARESAERDHILRAGGGELERLRRRPRTRHRADESAQVDSRAGAKPGPIARQLMFEETDCLNSSDGYD